MDEREVNAIAGRLSLRDPQRASLELLARVTAALALEKDTWGNWVISADYNAEMLAEAVCKIEGFTYAPSTELYWIHGHSSERDHCWVTTQELTAAQLQSLSDEVGPDRSLLVCCTAWLGDAAAWPNLTLKKIPNAVLARCEFGKDDYSLRIAALPAATEPATDED